MIPGWVRPPNPWWALFWPSPIGDGTLYPDGYPPYWNESEDEGEDGKQCPTDHGKKRQQEGRSDSHRDVGDPNKVEQRGRKFYDTDTGNTVHVDGDRVVIVDSKGRRVTQFKNPRRNTQDRIRRGKWVPK